MISPAVATTSSLNPLSVTPSPQIQPAEDDSSFTSSMSEVEDSGTAQAKTSEQEAKAASAPDEQQESRSVTGEAAAQESQSASQEHETTATEEDASAQPSDAEETQQGAPAEEAKDESIEVAAAEDEISADQESQQTAAEPPEETIALAEPEEEAEATANAESEAESQSAEAAELEEAKNSQTEIPAPDETLADDAAAQTQGKAEDKAKAPATGGTASQGGTQAPATGQAGAQEASSDAEVTQQSGPQSPTAAAGAAKSPVGPSVLESGPPAPTSEAAAFPKGAAAATEQRGAAQVLGSEGRFFELVQNPQTRPGQLPPLIVQIMEGRNDLANGRRLHIRLDPPDLGAFDLRLERLDSLPRVVIASERSDTLELLMRHRESLLEMLREAGFDLSQSRMHFGPGRGGERMRDEFMVVDRRDSGAQFEPGYRRSEWGNGNRGNIWLPRENRLDVKV